MKKLIFILGILLSSCNQANLPIEHTPEKQYIVRCEYGDGMIVLSIVEIDGHQYILTNNGGIVHSESCPCKE